jgi:hypothetical protein
MDERFFIAREKRFHLLGNRIPSGCTEFASACGEFRGGLYVAEKRH